MLLFLERVCLCVCARVCVVVVVGVQYVICLEAIKLQSTWGAKETILCVCVPMRVCVCVNVCVRV